MSRFAQALTVLSLFAAAQSAQATLVSYWSFDTDFTDATGAHDGTPVNNAAISTGNMGVNGGEALQLNGGSGTTGDHVLTANPTTFDFNSDFTWHAWVKTASANGGIFGRAAASPIIHNQGSKSLFINSGNVRWDTGWVSMPNTGVNVTDDQWHLIIATYVADTDQLDVFVDPSPGATTGDFSGTHDVNRYDEHTHVHQGGIADTSFRIGQISDNFQNASIVGLIDEAAIFDTALTGADLDKLIQQGPAAFLGGIIGDFDGDGDVDGVDIAEMFSNFNGPGGGVPTNPDTDLDGDGDVDGVDIAQLFGAFTGPLTPASVPEPAGLTLFAFGGLLYTRRSRSDL